MKMYPPTYSVGRFSSEAGNRRPPVGRFSSEAGNRRPRPRSGFTLIEMALSALVIGLGILTLFGLTRLAVQSSGDAEAEVRAAMFADNLFATLRCQSDRLNDANDPAEWSAFWERLANAETNLVDGAAIFWKYDDTLPQVEVGFPRIFAATDFDTWHTNRYIAVQHDARGSDLKIPDFTLLYNLRITLEASTPSLGQTNSRAHVQLHVRPGRMSRHDRPHSFYTHFFNHGRLP